MILDFLFTQSVSVQPYLGESATGSKYDTARAMSCFVEEVARLSSDSTSEERTGGKQSALQFSTSMLHTSLDNQATVPVGSIVTLPGGTITRVRQVNIFRGPVTDMGDHLEVHLI